MHADSHTAGVDKEAVRTLGSGLEFTGLAQVLIGGLVCLLGVFAFLASFAITNVARTAQMPPNMPDIGMISKLYMVFSVVYVALGVILVMAGMKARAGRVAAATFLEEGRIGDLNGMLLAMSQHFGYLRYLIITIVISIAVMFIFFLSMMGQMMASMPHGG